MKKVDIIVPVYKGFDETTECIISVHKSIPDWAQLIIVNDCSPDEELTLWLENHVEKYNYQLYRNDTNLGFVKTVNFGMKLNLDHDVLLLNSDVEVPNSDWLDRIRTAACSRPKLASITPFSNNATICSFPHFCEDNDLFSDHDTTSLDNIFSKLELEEELIHVPTGVGFCMYMTRASLGAIGYFDDETFGKGYGEENDWCQRAEKKGWLNYHQLNVFAYHKGGVSFEEEGDPRKENALNLLADLHPYYERDVHSFIQKDPAEVARNQALWTLFRESEKQKILFISHNLGGGVKQHLQELYTKYKNNVDFVQIVPGINGESVVVSFFSAGDELKYKYKFSLPTDYQDLITLLKFINIDRMHFHHTMGLPIEMFGLKDDLGLVYDLTVHDYYLVNGNPTLTDEKHQFIGDVDLELIDKKSEKKFPIPCSGETWRNNNQRLIEAADRVIFPSLDTCKRFDAVFDMENVQSVVAYHSDSYENISLKLQGDGKQKILILGALSKEKGADVLEAVAKRVDNVEFHLLGYAYRPLASVITHGSYDINEVNKLIEKINPSHIWFPAQWPETYSYTLSIALRFNIPIIYPNLGALPERVKKRTDSICLPWNLDVNKICDFFQKGCVATENYTEELYFNTHVLDNFYDTNYLNFEKLSSNDTEAQLSALVISVIKKKVYIQECLTSKERILLFLWKLRTLPVVKNILKPVPHKFQKKIKRGLSPKPMHDLINK